MRVWRWTHIIIGTVIALCLSGAAVAFGLLRSGLLGPLPGPSPTVSVSASPTSTAQALTAPSTSAPPSSAASPSSAAAPSTASSSRPSEPETTPQSPSTPAEPSSPQPAGFPASLRGVDLERLPTSQHVVALTFDAGANDAALTSILSTLAANGVPGTFFLTGAWAARYPAGVAEIVAGGYRVGNHSMTHPSFTTLTDAQIAAQLSDAEASIRVAGADPRPLFRFPSGDRDARTIADVNGAGYAAFRWTVDTLGWQGTMNGTRGPAFIVQRVLAAAQPGEIVLMHLGSNPDDASTLDADALPQVISQLRAAGYGFVTLDAALG
ncbi:polysaccharide deacetylase family protein [Sinomonas sp. JGH33]|uniref:Polysaccharide deacetylase family protein n=1 Tax=Sinomonas terricola TaxID=3110330 RepID=A0ABU5T1F0_9MICC|nr:polysaccharide deacetylase family protein [Sinomonas sp. JGH33]MEA5453410.1 polysaccharide deacetylase family protein [Sinomonas sp. JGH33]